VQKKEMEESRKKKSKINKKTNEKAKHEVIATKVKLKENQKPYQPAIDLIKTLATLKTPTAKIECLLDVNKVMSQCLKRLVMFIMFNNETKALCSSVIEFYKDKKCEQRDMMMYEINH